VLDPALMFILRFDMRAPALGAPAAAHSDDSFPDGSTDAFADLMTNLRSSR
jgi:hypothetical protein